MAVRRLAFAGLGFGVAASRRLDAAGEALIALDAQGHEINRRTYVDTAK